MSNNPEFSDGRPARLTACLEAQGIDFIVDYRFYWATDIITEFPIEAEYNRGRSGTLQVRRIPNHDCS